MPRKPQTWGVNVDGRVRLIVAALSKGDAARALAPFGITTYRMRLYSDVSEDVREKRIAEAELGIVFSKATARDAWWKRVTP